MRHLLIVIASATLAVSSAYAQATPQTLDGQLRQYQMQKGAKVIQKTSATTSKKAGETGFTIVGSSLDELAPSAGAAGVASYGMPVSRSGEVIDSVGNGAIPALPIEMVSENGVSYLSGGIGDEEVEQLKSQENQFNIRLQITGMNGEYASGVSLAIRNSSGAVVANIADAGPFVYVKAPAGVYQVEAGLGTERSKALTLNAPATGAAKAHLKIGM